MGNGEFLPDPEERLPFKKGDLSLVIGLVIEISVADQAAAFFAFDFQTTLRGPASWFLIVMPKKVMFRRDEDVPNGRSSAIHG